MSDQVLSIETWDPTFNRIAPPKKYAMLSFAALKAGQTGKWLRFPITRMRTPFGEQDSNQDKDKSPDFRVRLEIGTEMVLLEKMEQFEECIID